MKISIVTPSYNQDKYIERTILSIWNQKGDFELEHIIIDGGSSDQSMAIINKYDDLYITGQFKYQCRNFTFTWLSETDSGQSEALNKGFSVAKGEILGWLNSDDVFVNSNSLQAVYQAFVKFRPDIVVGNAMMIDECDNILSNIPIMINTIDNIDFQKKLASIQKYNLIIQPSCLFKHHIWKNHGIEQYFYIMDWALWINAYRHNASFLKIDNYVGCNRVQNESKTVFASLDKEEAIKRTEEIISLFERNNIWCLNKVYYLFYYQLLKLSHLLPVGYFLDRIIKRGKRIRNYIVHKAKLYML